MFPSRPNLYRLLVASVAVAVFLVGFASCGKFFVASNAVVSIAVTPADPTVQPGKTQQFTATATLGSGSTKDVSTSATWTSSSSSVATVDSTGLATAVGTGTATITASNGGQNGATDIIVTTATLTTIAINAPNTTLARGQTEQLAATGTYS